MSPALSKDSNVFNGRKGGVRILVVAGASGGHIFPALGFLDTLKYKPGIETLLILPRISIRNHTQDFGYKINFISICPIKLSLNFKNLAAILKFLKGSLESIFILLGFRPDIVVGFGSLTSIPMVMFARLFRIKTLIHEQNVIPGRANRFLAKFTDIIAISFLETKDYFKAQRKKIAFTGNPMRKVLNRIDKQRALEFFGFSDNKFTMLVMGGSLGSHKVNIQFLNALSMISNKLKLQIVHLSGIKDYDLLTRRYKDLDVSVKLFSFLEAMQYAYSACDLILSRAGATTVAEIIYFGLPAIIVPYPYAYKHQLSNAKILENKGCALIIPDSQLSAQVLKKTIEGFLNNPGTLNEMRSRYNGFARLNASSMLVEQALSLN